MDGLGWMGSDWLGLGQLNIKLRILGVLGFPALKTLVWEGDGDWGMGDGRWEMGDGRKASKNNNNNDAAVW